MPAINLRLLRLIWHQNPPGFVILFGIVFFIAGYVYAMVWTYGVFILGFGVALLLAGGAFEIAWLRRKRKTLLEP